MSQQQLQYLQHGITPADIDPDNPNGYHVAVASPPSGKVDSDIRAMRDALQTAQDDLDELEAENPPYGPRHDIFIRNAKEESSTTSAFWTGWMHCQLKSTSRNASRSAVSGPHLESDKLSSMAFLALWTGVFRS